MAALLYSMNRLPVWKQSMTVEGVKHFAPTFDRLLYLFLQKNRFMGQTERKTLNHLIRPGMRILDIGANLGVYAVRMARLTGESGSVLALEPDPDLYAALCSTKEANQVTNLKALCVAAGAQTEQLMLARGNFNSGDNYVVSAADRGFSAREAVPIQTRPLDEICGETVFDFIKMDVQGYEPPVLAGGEKVFNCNPDLQILFEYWPEGIRRAGGRPESVLEKFTTWGYQLTGIENEYRETVTNFQKLTDSLKGISSVDLLATRKGHSPTLSSKE